MDDNKEQLAINYLRGQLDMSDPNMVLQVYTQVIEQDVFHTELGFAFLQELKDYLYQSGSIDVNRIPDFGVSPAENALKNSGISQGSDGVSKVGSAEKRSKIKGASKEEVARPTSEKTGASLDRSAENQSKKARVPRDGSAGSKSKKTRIPRDGSAGSKSKKARVSRDGSVWKRAKEAGYQKLFIGSLFLNVVLIIMVIAMFALTLTSDSPNIVNYKTKIENEYASWEQELRQREQQILKKEQELQKNEAALQEEMYLDEQYE